MKLSVFDLYTISMLLVEVWTLSLNVMLFSFGGWLLCWLKIYKTPTVNYVMTVCKIPFGSHQRVKAVLSQKKKPHACTVCLKKITGESFNPGEDELLLLQNIVCFGCYN